MRCWSNEKNKLTLVTCLLAAIVLLIAVEIEMLNMEAGGILPRKEEYRNGDPDQGLVKWRESPCINEQGWRMMRNIPADHLLTEAETARMRREVEKAKAGNYLRGLVGSAGLWQHLLVPLLMLLSVKLLLRSVHSSWLRTALGTVSLLISIGAGVLMLSRAYWTSLGW